MKLMLRDDWRFLRSKTQNLPRAQYEQVYAEYRRRFYQAHRAEKVEHRKANAGRLAANTWLREYNA